LKKLIVLTLGLIGCTLASALAQGTIAFGNNVARRIMVSYQGAEPRLATATDGLTFGLFYGPAVRQVTLGQTSGPGAVIYSTPGDTTFRIIPEPVTLAVAGLAGLLFGIVRWRRR
jgi:hypothetical protein